MIKLSNPSECGAMGGHTVSEGIAEQSLPSELTPVGSSSPVPGSRTVNVGKSERVMSGIAGASLVLLGLNRRSIPGVLAASAGAMLMYRAFTGNCAVYRAMGVNTAADGQAEPTDYFERGIHVVQAVTVNLSQKALYEYWRDLANLPQIMSHLKSVDVIDDKRSHWVAKGPLGASVEWDAEIINDEPYELIAWRSLADAEVHNAGSVRFIPAPGNRGTEVRVTIEYIPVAGKIGVAIAKILGAAPDQQVKEDLHRFKQVMESGEAPATQAQPRGRMRP